MLRKNKKRIYFYIGLVLILLIFFHFTGFLYFLSNTSKKMVIPISSNLYSLSIKTKEKFAYIFKKNEIEENYKNCIKEKQEINIDIARLKMLEEENKELKEQLNFKNENNYNILPARVIGKDLGTGQQIIMINLGEKDGLKLNSPVTIGYGVLVGKVSKVEEENSFVRLINDNQSKIAGTILNQEKSLGSVEGGFGISLRMKFIPRNEKVLIGDKIITSGLENGMPKGLLIGTVAVVENEAYKPFQQAILEPAGNLNNLSSVSVIIFN